MTFLALFLAAAFATGCGKSGDGFNGPRGEVQGTISLKGSPLPAGCSVLFQAAKGPAFMASGSVKEGGTYQLQYRGSKKLPAVEYKVQVSPPPDKEKHPAQDASQINAETMKEAPAVKLPYPEKYSSFRTSPLKFTVEEGSNVADFDLEE